MVDLHAHSDRSDGELPPEELVELAHRRGLAALAITDHDSVEGYDAAAPHARRLGLEFICGVELNSKFRGRSIHILGYFLDRPPGDEFRSHLSCLQKARRERNQRLTKRLQELGLSVRLEEAEALGRSQTGRPHFAHLLVRKGYASGMRDAFDRYLDERAPGYVERRDPSLENVLRWIRAMQPSLPLNMEPLVFVRRDMFGHPGPAALVTAPVMAGSEEEARAALALLQTCPVLGKAVKREVDIVTELDGLLQGGEDLLYPQGARYFADNMWTNASADALLPGMRKIAATLPPAPSHMMWMLWGPTAPRPCPARTRRDGCRSWPRPSTPSRSRDPAAGPRGRRPPPGRTRSCGARGPLPGNAPALRVIRRSERSSPRAAGPGTPLPSW